MIDVIIPLYNSHNTLYKTLFSINMQTIKKDITVYLIDDNSKEDYDDIVELFKDKIKIKLFKLDSNKGPGYARQYGLDHSKSKYVIFVDSDDVFHNIYSLERILDTIESNNLDVVSSNMSEITDNQIYEYQVGFDTLHSKIYKREYLEKNKISFPNLYNSEDLAFNNLVMISKPKIGYCDWFVYSYVRRKDSLSTRNEYYKNTHIKKYMESLLWVIDTAEKQKKDKVEIGSIIVSSTAYLYYYFHNNMEDKTINYIYEIIDYYDKYEKYLPEDLKVQLILFWVNRMENNQVKITYYDFMDILRERRKKL